MEKVTKIIIGILAVIILILAGVAGYFIIKKSNANKPKTLYPIVMEEMYSNVKNSKRIVKIKIIVESSDKKDTEFLEEKKYLIRDIANEIIRSTEEQDLIKDNSQNELQDKIKNKLVEQLKINSIEDVKFSDFVIQ